MSNFRVLKTCRVDFYFYFLTWFEVTIKCAMYSYIFPNNNKNGTKTEISQNSVA